MLGPAREIRRNNAFPTLRLPKGFLINPVMLPLRDHVPVEDDSVVLYHYLAHIAGDFQPVGARRLPGGCNVFPCGAVVVFEVGHHIVLYLDIIIFAKAGLGEYPVRHPEHPLPEIKLVRILIDQRTAAFRLPGRTPCTAVMVGLGAVPVCDNPRNPLYMAQLPLLYHFT